MPFVRILPEPCSWQSRCQAHVLLRTAARTRGGRGLHAWGLLGLFGARQAMLVSLHLQGSKLRGVPYSRSMLGRYAH